MSTWIEEIKNSITEAETLAEKMGWQKDREERCSHIIEKYPMAITPYYFSLIDQNDPDDPIAKMAVPSFAEMDNSGSLDTSGEASNTKLEGMQHKYKQTALLLSTNQCAMYCRHCFRRRMVGLSVDELNKRVDEVVDYVKSHEEINNVLITGGDSLMLSNGIIRRYLQELSSIAHVDLLRFGSRIPVVLPERIYGDSELLELFKVYGKGISIVLVTQFNHPRELTEEADRAIRALQDVGVQVRNQTVLLKGVNDDPAVLGALIRGLVKRNVVPYYIFQCRPVTGVKQQFQVPILDGIRIVDEAKKLQNGLGRAVRFAMSHPRGKIEIVGNTESGETVFKFHQNKAEGDACRLFVKKLDPDTCWLDDDL